MRLSLSSDAAPDLPLAGLLEGCRRRGLAGLELVAGGSQAWGEGDALKAADAVGREAAEAGVAITAFAVPLGEVPSVAELRFAAALGAPVLVDASGLSVFQFRKLASRQKFAGGRILLLHGTDPVLAASLHEAVAGFLGESAGLAWEIAPSRDDAGSVEAVLDAAGPALEYVRLRGGGPEAVGQTGWGVGALMARLALRRYAGPLVLAPSTPTYGHVWRTWLGSGAGWGCGSKQSDPLPLLLPVVAHEPKLETR